MEHEAYSSYSHNMNLPSANQYLIDFYSHYNEDGRLSSRHGMVEFLTTMRYIRRYLKPGGVIFAAHVISDGCLLDEGFLRGNVDVKEYVKNGLLAPRTFAAKSEPKDLFELVRKEDVDHLMSGFPTARLHYVASDGCALLLREAIDQMDRETFDLYLRYHFATCEREDLSGVTSHTLDIFRRLGG